MLTRMDASEAWQAELASRSWDRLFLAGNDFAAYLAQDTDRIRSVLQGLGLAAG